MNKGNLFNLSKQKIPGDLIDVSKMFIWFRDINAENYITVERLHRARRNYHFKISRKIFSWHKAKHFNRVVSVWNYVPRDVVDSTRVTSFKNRLSK